MAIFLCDVAPAPLCSAEVGARLEEFCGPQKTALSVGREIAYHFYAAHQDAFLRRSNGATPMCICPQVIQKDIVINKDTDRVLPPSHTPVPGSTAVSQSPKRAALNDAYDVHAYFHVDFNERTSYDANVPRRHPLRHSAIKKYRPLASRT